MDDASFDRVISDHLALSERNRRLERQMPLDRYREKIGGGGESKPETLAAGQEPWLDPDSSWDATRERPLPDFDWGDD